MTPRGRAIWLAGVAALLPALAAAQPADAPELAATPAFVAPAKPMVLTRTLRRPLADGREVVSLRSYLLHFRTEQERIRVDGLLLAVTIDAPSALEPLVEMERRRGDDGMFPMWLDMSGMLLPRGAVHADPKRQEAIERTASRIGAFGLAPHEETQARAFVASVDIGKAGHTPWPRDLFRPARSSTRDTHAMPLPDGQKGEVVVETSATLHDGILASLTRTTTTNLAGDRRSTTEEWTLVEAP